MKCPRCGNDTGDTAKFCSTCGSPIERAASEQPAQVEETSASRLPMKTLLIATLVGAGVLLVVALALALLRPRANAPLAQSPSVPSPSAPIAQSPIQPYAPSRPLAQTDIPPAPTAPKAPPEEKAPQEVLDYLNFVKAVEDKRKSMRLDFGPALEMLKSAYGAQLGLDLDEYEPGSPGKISKGYAEYTQNWNELLMQFDRVQAPEPCRQLAGAYRQALGTYVSAMIKIQISMSQNDIGTLLAMRSKAQPDIDAQLRQADSQLEQVTKRYKLEKTFAISPDREVDSILGM